MPPLTPPPTRESSLEPLSPNDTSIGVESINERLNKELDDTRIIVDNLLSKCSNILSETRVTYTAARAQEHGIQVATRNKASETTIHEERCNLDRPGCKKRKSVDLATPENNGAQALKCVMNTTGDMHHIHLELWELSTKLSGVSKLLKEVGKSN